jgi:hypothetical protein
MNDLFTYHVRLSGRLTADDLNAMSPLALTVEESEAATTLLSICTDQSGLIGIMRHLHGLGCVFLSVTTETRDA